MRKPLIAFILIFSVLFSYAQNFSNKGKEFWVAYGFHVRMAQSNGGGSNINAQNMVLYFATDEVTTITISIPSLGYSQTLTSPATPTVLTSAVIPKAIPQDARLTAESTSPEDKGIHIVADKPVVAYAHIYDGSVSGATILFPVTTLGKEYYSINYTARSNENNSNAWFYVIATDTGTTTVEITPSANTINMTANTTYTINMTQGQVFNVMGQFTGTTGGGGGGSYSGVDLTGSKIKSIASGNGACKRIAVFSGSGKMYISCDGSSSSSDNYMVQAFPKDAWGKKFLTVPTSSLVNNFFRICVTNPATPVRVNGAALSTATLINNFYYDLPLTSVPQKIESDDPITVAQYIASQGECGNPTPTGTYPGDPEVIYLSSVEQNIAKVLWNATPFAAITQHYYNVVIPNAGTAISSFKLDGVNVSPASFTIHPQDANFSYLSSRLSASGVHSIESDSGFNAIAYGYGSAESYGYNAGTNIKDLYNFLAPVNPYSITTDPVACTGSPVYLTVTFPFEPTYLNWNFNANPNQSPNANQVMNSPVADTTYLIGNKRVWRYKLPILYTFNPSNTSPGYLISITAGTQSVEGCGSSLDRDFYLAVYDPPVAQIYWSNNGCVTDTVRFRDTTTYLAGTYPYKYFWDYGDGTTDSVRHPKHKYANAGTYIVKFCMISNVGCFSDTTRDTITVTNVPTASFSITSPTCINTTVDLTNTSTIVSPGNIKEWHWTYGDGNTQTITLPANGNAQHLYANLGPVTPQLYVVSNSGCVSNTFLNPINIGAYPLASFSVPASVCLPYDSARFINLSTISDNTPSSLSTVWTFGNPASGIYDTVRNAAPTHYYSSPGSYSVHLITTSVNGCVDDTTISFSNVYAQAIASFTTLPENCYNTPTNFVSTSTGNGRTISTWFWDFGDGSAIGNGQTISHTYATPGTKTIKHWVQLDVGCYSDTMVQTVIINPLPTASFTSTGPFCTTRLISFRSTSVANAGNITNWSWNMGDGTLYSFSNPNAFNHTFNNIGNNTISLTVTTDKGCVSILRDTTIYIHAIPVAGFIDPEVCLSDTYAQFTDTSHVVGGTIVSWNWNFDHPQSGAANTSTLQNPRHSYATIGTKNVTFIVTSNQGCKDTTIQSFFVNGDIPVAGLQVLNPTRLCANDSVAIKDLSTVNVGSVVKVDIYWDALGAPTTFETDQLPYNGKIYKHLYPNFQTPLTKTYTIRFRAYSGETCVDDFTQTITMNAAPKVRFNIIPDTCQHILPFQITQASEIGGVPGTFVFTGQGITSAGVYNPELSVSGTFNLHYVFSSTAAGCADSADQPIKILQPPTANYGYSLPTCEKKQVLFTDSSIAPVGNLTTWTWNFGDGTPILVRNTNSPFNHVFTNPGIYNVILFVTTDDGCNSKTKVIEVDIHPEPLAKFKFSDTACLPNALVRFNNTSTIPDGTVSTLSYTWNFGDPASGVQNTSTAINPNHIFTTTGPYNVTLNVVSINGCKDDSTIRVNTIHPQPKANFNFSKPSVCIGDNVRFIDASDPKDGTTIQWHWSFDDGNSSIQTSPIHTYTNVGVFSPSLYIVNSFGCNSDTINNSFNVYAYPVISAGPDLLILEGATMPLQATASGNQLQYLWTSNQYLNNDHLLNPLCTPLEDMMYTLTVTGEGGCPSIDQMKVKILKTPIIPNTFSPNNDGINDKWEIDYLKFYPNAKIQVFTRTGKLVFESKGYLKPWDGTKSGVALPLDTYYYIIEPESGRKPVTGFITIIK